MLVEIKRTSKLKMIPGTTNHCTAHVGYVCSVVCREDCLAVENLCMLLYYPINSGTCVQYVVFLMILLHKYLAMYCCRYPLCHLFV